MNAFLLELAANPQIPSFVLGMFVPRLYDFLKDEGKTPSDGEKTAFNVVLCIAVSLLPIYADWALHGMPTPAAFLSSLSAAFLASEGSYKLYFKQRAQVSGNDL